jgi:fused signal recognition particle receptor
MTGFFKKLFNRITGHKDEAAPPPPPEIEALPQPELPAPPESEPEPLPSEPAVESLPPEPVEIEPTVAELPSVAVETEAPVEAKPALARVRPAAKKPEAEPEARIEPKKSEPKRSEQKKPEPKKPEPRKVELKKLEPKKPEPKTPEPAKAAQKKAELKKPEPKRPEAKKPEPKKPEVKKPKPRKPEPKTPEPRPTEVNESELRARPAPKPAPRPEPIEGPLPAPEAEIIAEPIVPEPLPTPEIIAEPVPASEPDSIEPREPEPAAIDDVGAVEAELPPVEEDAAAAEPQPLPRPPSVMQREATPPPQTAREEPQPRGGWFSRLKEGLAKSSRSLTGSITAIFTKRKLDSATLEELEDVLIQADLGVEMTTRIVKAVATGRYDKEIEPDEVKAILASEVAKVLKPVEIPFNFGEEKPFVILVVGVNGSGKTTTIGKLGAIATGEGFSVMLAACDTFRAAAIEQLAIWGQRIGAKVISRPTGADAAGLAFDAMKEAKADAADILIVDTAGRLQNKANLMAELDKIVRVIKKQDETAPHAVLLVLDATTGQNAISQADVFTKVAGVTGLIMTKLDGTARGGILVAIAERFKLPIHAIGVGEQIEDLQPFDADAFSRAIAGFEE